MTTYAILKAYKGEKGQEGVPVNILDHAVGTRGGAEKLGIPGLTSIERIVASRGNAALDGAYLVGIDGDVDRALRGFRERGLASPALV